MSKGIGKARRNTRNLMGIRSAVKAGQYAGDGIFHDNVDYNGDESYTDYTQYVRLSTDGIKSYEEFEKLSGEVKEFNINDLPEEERKKYARK